MLAEGGPDARHPAHDPRADRGTARSAAGRGARRAGERGRRGQALRPLGAADPARRGGPVAPSTQACSASRARTSLTARPGREDAYRFRHVLIRDAAYAGIAEGAARADCTNAIAEWAANTRAGRAGDVDEIVGYHLEQAVRYRQQLGPLDTDGAALARARRGHARRGGRRAFARDDAPAAVNLLDRAVALATDEQPARLDLSRELGLALWSLGEVARAEALLNGDRGRCGGGRRQARGVVRAARAVRRCGAWSTRPTTPTRSRSPSRRFEVFSELGDEFGLARSWRAVGLEHRRRGHLGESEKACERALEHAVRAGDRREESRSADQLCTALLYGPAEATAALARCEAMLVRAGGNPLFEANVLASGSGPAGDARRVRRGARRGSACGDDLRRPRAAGSHWPGLTQIAGPIELLAGDADAAERVIRRGYDILHQIGSDGRLGRPVGRVALRPGTVRRSGAPGRGCAFANGRLGRRTARAASRSPREAPRPIDRRNVGRRTHRDRARLVQPMRSTSRPTRTRTSPKCSACSGAQRTRARRRRPRSRCTRARAIARPWPRLQPVKV